MCFAYSASLLAIVDTEQPPVDLHNLDDLCPPASIQTRHLLVLPCARQSRIGFLGSTDTHSRSLIRIRTQWWGDSHWCQLGLFKLLLKRHPLVVVT
jgi:hypothetical protein